MQYLSKAIDITNFTGGNFSGSLIVPPNSLINFANDKPVLLKSIQGTFIPDTRFGLGSSSSTMLYWSVIFKSLDVGQLGDTNPNFKGNLDESFIAGNYVFTDITNGDDIYIAIGGQEDKWSDGIKTEILTQGLQIEYIAFKRNVNISNAMRLLLTFGYEIL